MDFYRKKFEAVKESSSKLDLVETELAIKMIKDNFQKALSSNLNLLRVSAPLFVRDSSGLNDDLNGIERKVKMEFKNGVQASVVNSLAKWKRYALYKYNIQTGKGLYTDMNAIRPDEDLSNIHSYYVDQWDWEMAITASDRNIDFLRRIVTKIYNALKETDKLVRSKYPFIVEKFPEDIFFITSQEMEDLYPDLTPKEREYEITKRHKAVFIMKIGGKLNSGIQHDGRAPDYDDWELNGDIVMYNPILDIPYELSSMGIRVDPESLMKQLKLSGNESRKNFEFHSMLLRNELPLSIGGGIGQSRICMFLLDKLHIGEVQVSDWDDDVKSYCQKRNIKLL